MNVGGCAPEGIGSPQRGAEPWQRVAAGQCADEQSTGLQAMRNRRSASGKSLTVSSVPTATIRSNTSSGPAKHLRSHRREQLDLVGDQAEAIAPVCTKSPTSNARSNRRSINAIRSRQSSNARSCRNSVGPPFDARLCRSARSFMSNRSGIHQSLVRWRTPGDKNRWLLQSLDARFAS